MKILKQGINGAETEIVQGFLKDEGFYAGKIDGQFGPSTDNAVKLYQKANGLIPDGIVGNRTYSIMKSQGFKMDGTELERLGITKQEIIDIVDANSFYFIAKRNDYNPFPTTFDPENDLHVVAIRGFKLNLGKEGENDRSIFDDAHFIINPKKNEIRAFEGNTDPNGYRKGYGYGSKKGMAMLTPGVWFYGKGRHKGSPAFRQCAPVTVKRDGNPDYKDTGYFAINWHSAGNNSTSSLGCQTNRPNDFVQIRDYIYENFKDNPKMQNDWGQSVNSFPYVLIEESERKKGNLKIK